MGNRPTPQVKMLTARLDELAELIDVDYMIGHAYIAAGQIDTHAEHAGEVATTDERAEDFYAVCKMAAEIGRTLDRGDVEAVRQQIAVVRIHLSSMDGLAS